MARRRGRYNNGSQRVWWVGARHETSVAERPLVRLGTFATGAELDKYCEGGERVVVASQF
jgi:hypothetical protein